MGKAAPGGGGGAQNPLQKSVVPRQVASLFHHVRIEMELCRSLTTYGIEPMRLDGYSLQQAHPHAILWFS